MLRLNIEAPFATFRIFSAGSFRPTAEFMTPTAAYGLLLNLAGIDSRLDDGKSPMTLMREDLPHVRIALGIPARGGGNALALPRMQSIYQQLHNYPVGASGKDHAKNTMGSKYNITPVRRQFLVDLRATLAVECDADLAASIEKGLRGLIPRYGLPFLGDNSFFPDRIEISSADTPTFWYERLDESNAREIREGATRMTAWIDRADMSKTVSHLYAPIPEPSSEIPETAWTVVGPPQG